MRITRTSRGGVYRPNATGLDQVPDTGGMDGGGDVELEQDDGPDTDYDPLFIKTDAINRARNNKPFFWLKRSRRDRFTHRRYRYLSHLFDAEEPNVAPMDRDEDFRRPERIRLWNLTRTLKYHMVKRKRKRNKKKSGNGDFRNND